MKSNSTIPVITVDGPSGSGKGTLSRLLARELGWHMLDSGALYRLLALAAQKHGVSVDNVPALAVLGEHLEVVFEEQNDKGPLVLLEGQDVTDAIRTEECGKYASMVSQYPDVREALLARQRSFKRSPGLVADGRDMGTVIFPEAQIKFFLEASSEIRAKRRFFELQQRGLDVSLENLLSEIEARDIRDRERKASPLVAASDALVLDTSIMSISEVLEAALAKLRSVGFVTHKVTD